jgi:3-methylfumaryl-CoA hydratase
VDEALLKSWIGRRETGVDYVTIPLVHRIAAMLDRDDPLPRHGDPLPAGWQSVLFPRVARHSQLGPDGHPRRGDFVPPVPLPRRMNGGKRIVFSGELRVGDEVQRVSTIDDVQLKRGRSGALVVLTVKTEMHTARGLAVTELQDLLYRDHPAPDAPRLPPEPAPTGAQWHRSCLPDAVMLFRFSALTYNGHRIHYDQAYVTQVEGYPERIVNGGLTALLVFELARQHLAAPIEEIAIRNRRAMFVGQPFTVYGRADGAQARFWIIDCEGAMSLSAQARLAH